MSTRILTNIIWLLFEKSYKVIISISLVIFVARSYGPTLYGQFTYTLTILSLLTSLTLFGMKNIVIKRYVRLNKIESKTTIKSALYIAYVASILAFFGYVITIKFFIPEVEIFTHVLIVSTLFFKPFDVVRYYYEANINSKVIVKFESVLLVFFFFIKFYFAYFDYNIKYIYYSVFFESLTLAAVFLFMSKKDKLLTLQPSTKGEIKSIVKASFPLFIASGVWVLYTKIDQLMIANILGMKSQGIYFSALQISDFIVIIPTVIIASVIPALEKKYTGKERDIKYKELYLQCNFILLPIIFFINLFALDIMVLLFGESYLEGATILSITSFSSIFVIFSIISGQYMTFNGQQYVVLQRQVLGLVTNALLNYFFIQKFGMCGAAFATLLSLFVATFLFDITSKKTRVCFFHKCNSFNFWNLKYVFDKKRSP